MICPYSLTVPGGVQEQVLSLARVMRRDGLDVRVLAPCDGPPPDGGVTALGASLPTAANGSIAPIAPDLPAQLRLLRALRSERFDVLHVHEPLAPGIGITTVLVQAAPLVGTFHAGGQSAAYRWGNRACRALRRRIDIAAAVSDEAETLARTWLGGTYERVFNGIEIGSHNDRNHRDSDQQSVLFVGRHEQRKGLQVLLEALSHLDANLEVWVVGEGPLTAQLRDAYRGDSRVRWLGAVSDREKRALLARASMLCAPSLGGESFGLVLLEAMASTTPVIASAIPGYVDVTRQGRDATLVAPGDSRGLASAITQVLNGGADVQRRVDSGLERASQFSMESLAKLYVDMYERLCGPSSIALGPKARR